MSIRCRASPFSQPIRTAGISPTSTGAAYKAYKINVPVYAGGPEAKQADWNKITHTFAITDPTGARKEYEVLHNLATPKGSLFKLYPNTGVAAEGSSYFPLNQWGFAISSRNLKQYNWNMVMDAMLWNNYQVQGVGVEWIPNQGALQAGSVEVCLLNNAQEMPAIPYINAGVNSVSFTATQRAGKAFTIQNQTNPVKEMKSVQSEFDAVADYGILWVRSTGFHFPNNPADAIVEVGSINITIGVALLNAQASAHAQLIGAWVEAGYPIKPEDGRTVTTRQTSTIGSAMIIFENNQNGVTKDKRSHPRWYKVPTKTEKNIKAVAGPSAVKAAGPKPGANESDLPFPELVQTDFDGAVTGKSVLQAAAEGATVADANAVVKPQDGGDQFVAYASTLYVDQAPEINPAVGASENGSKVLLNFYPNQAASNGHALASGDIEVPFDGAAIGKSVGVTIKTLTSFPVGSQPPVDGTASNAVTLGWEPGLGVASDVSREFEPETGNGLKQAVKIVASGLAGVLNAVANSTTFDGVNALSAGSTDGSKAEAFVGTNSNGTDASVEVQSVGLVCPDNAAYRTKIAEITGAEKDIAEKFFGEFPLCAKYGVKSFKPDKLTNEMARISVNGQLNTLHTALLATYGQALPSVGGLTYNTEVAEVLYLVASRVDPAKDPEGFFNSAIPIIPTSDAKSGTAASGPMFKQNAGTGANGYFTVDKVTSIGNQLRVNNNPLGAICQSQVVSSSVCNFTLAWPDKLWDADTAALTELKAGETMFVALIKSTAVTYSHPIIEGTGSFRFAVFPELLPGLDKAAADQALHKYSLTIGAGSDAPTTFSKVQEGDAFEKSVYMMEDTERRFSLQSTTPVGDEGGNGLSGWLKLKRVY